MKFTMVEETFGSKSNRYSNSPTTDVECILRRIGEFKSSATDRHVVFVGEGHDNRYDTSRRATLLSEIAKNGQKHFPNGVPKVVSERFGDVASKDVDMKEPDIADDLPKEFTALRKPNIQEEERATGVLTKSETERKLSGPASQSRNQWFAYAIMQTIQKSSSEPVPIVVVCGDDHAPFVSAALSDLAKNGYPSSVGVLWHHFPSATDAVQPMTQVQSAFNFDLNGKTPAGFIEGKVEDAHLVLLAEGILPEPFGVQLTTPFSFGGKGWALFFKSDTRAAAVRGMVAKSGKQTIRITADQPCRTLEIKSRDDVLAEWDDVFGDLM
jgi:hypothetical protein